MNIPAINDALHARMQQFEHLHPALALVEYDCIAARVVWTVACSDSLAMPICREPLSLRRWLSSFDRATRKIVWRACTTMLAQRNTGYVLELPSVALADGRMIALTAQIDIRYAPDHTPVRMAAIVLRLNGPQATYNRALHPAPRGLTGAIGTASSQAPAARPSHAMRGGLGAIAAATEILRSGVGSAGVRERALQIIERQTQQLTCLVATTYDQT